MAESDYFQLDIPEVAKITGQIGRADAVCIFRFRNPEAAPLLDQTLTQIHYREKIAV